MSILRYLQVLLKKQSTGSTFLVNTLLKNRKYFEQLFYD